MENTDSPQPETAQPVHPALLEAYKEPPPPSPGSLRPPADIWRDIERLKAEAAQLGAAREARTKEAAANYSAHLAGESDQSAVAEIARLQVQADLAEARINAAMVDLAAAEARVLEEDKAALKTEMQGLMAQRVKAGDDVVATLNALVQRMRTLRKLNIAAVQVMNRGKKLQPPDKRKQVLVLEAFMSMANPESIFDWMALHLRQQTGDVWFAKDVGGHTRAFDEFVRGTGEQAMNELAHLLE